MPRYINDDPLEEPGRPVLWTVLGLVLLLGLAGAGWHYGLGGIFFPRDGVVTVLPFTTEGGSGAPNRDVPIEGLVTFLGSELASQSKYDVQFQYADDAEKLTALRQSLRGDEDTRLILDGTAHAVGSSVRLHARLTDARSGTELWSGTVHGTAADAATTDKTGTDKAGQDLLPEIAEMARLIATAMRGTDKLQYGRSPPPRDVAERMAKSLVAAADWFPDEPTPRAWAQIVRLYEYAAETFPSDASILGHLAWRYAYAQLEYFTVDSESLDRAADLVARAAVLEPANSEYLLARCTLRRAQRLHEDAITACQAVLERDPKEIRAVIEIAHNLLELSRGPEALHWFQRAEDMSVAGPAADQDQWGGRRGMAVAFYVMGNLEAAARWMGLAVAAHPADPIARAWLAALQELLGRKTEAQEHMRAFLAIPTDGARKAGELPRVYMLSIGYNGRHWLLLNTLARLRSGSSRGEAVLPR